MSERGIPCDIQSEPQLSGEPDHAVTIFDAVCTLNRQRVPLTIRSQGAVAVFTKWNAAIGETVRVIGQRYGNVLDAQRVIRPVDPNAPRTS